MEPRSIQPSSLAIVETSHEPERRPLVEMTADRIQLLKDTLCIGATDAELELALQVIRRLQLDPFARQIAFIKRWNSDLQREVMSPHITIDGMRLIAQRTGKYGGQLGPWWCGEDGVWKDVWLSDESPAAAKVGIIRTDWAEPLYAVARFNAYAGLKKSGDLTLMWLTKGDILIAKCAESLGLRRTFPAELSGVYSDEDMQQADNPRPQRVNRTTGEIVDAPPKRVADGSQGARKPADWGVFWPFAKANGVHDAAEFQALTGQAIKGLTPERAREVLDAVLADMDQSLARPQEETEPEQ